MTWKARLPYLQNVMRFKLENCIPVIQTTTILHNFLIKKGRGYLDEPWVSSFDKEDTAKRVADIVCDTSVQSALKDELYHPKDDHWARKVTKMA